MLPLSRAKLALENRDGGENHHDTVGQSQASASHNRGKLVSHLQIRALFRCKLTLRAMGHRHVRQGSISLDRYEIRQSKFSRGKHSPQGNHLTNFQKQETEQSIGRYCLSDVRAPGKRSYWRRERSARGPSLPERM